VKKNYFQNGNLSFSAIEQGRGIPILMLHGFPDHAQTFRFQLPVLAEAGYRAIAPLMRGYEPSSQPTDHDYRLLSLAHDVLAFIEQSGGGKVHLLGHDWGAVVSYLVAAMAPEKLLSLTTIAIPPPERFLRDGLRKQPGQLLKSWYMLFFQWRGFSDYILEFNDWAFLEWLWRRWSPGWQLPEDELGAIKARFRQTGVKQAALAYYRNLFSIRSIPDTLATLRQMEMKKFQVPTLAVTGEWDGCMDTRLHDQLMNSSDFPGGLTVVRIEGAGHFLHQERPLVFNRHLLEHLNSSAY
jgi:pimeloyl-ACP methyl ester carboxylesterase